MRNFVFRQLFDRVSCTYTYLLGCPATKQAILIDPVIELVQRDLNLVKQLGLQLKYVANTHVHADHVTGSGELKKLLEQQQVKSIIGEKSGAEADLLVKENDRIEVGSVVLKVLSTPGHTNGCLTYVDNENRLAFTGDALLIRGCGRTDFQEGSSATLYDSVWQKILSLPEDYELYPAHDYNGNLVTTVGEERQYNPRLTKSKEEFIDIMANLNLEKPKMIDIAVKRNLKCGV